MQRFSIATEPIGGEVCVLFDVVAAKVPQYRLYLLVRLPTELPARAEQAQHGSKAFQVTLGDHVSTRPAEMLCLKNKFAYRSDNLQSVRMATKRLFLAALVGIGFTALSRAGSEPEQDIYELKRQIAESDAALNEAYRNLMSRLDANAAPSLRSAERDWLRFKELDSALCAALAGNTQRLLARALKYQIDEVRARTVQLEGIARGDRNFLDEAKAREWDRDLNRLYGILLRQLDNSSGTQLKLAQRAWIAFRDAHVRSGMLILNQFNGWGAIAELTEERIGRFEFLLRIVSERDLAFVFDEPRTEVESSEQESGAPDPDVPDVFIYARFTFQAAPRFQRSRLCRLSRQRSAGVHLRGRCAGNRHLSHLRIVDWLPNMKVSIEAARKSGRVCEAAICYTGNLLDPKCDKYPLNYYVKNAKELERMGAQILAIKDMAGVCRPYVAEKPVRWLREEIGLPIHFHTHDTSGINASSLLEASEADKRRCMRL